MYNQIKTVEAAFAALKMDINTVPDVSCWPETMRQHKIVEFKLQMVIAAINGDWVPNWNDTTEKKYGPWWLVQKDKLRASGSGLSFRDAGYGATVAGVGPRLVFQTREQVYHAAEHFKALYEEYYLG